MSGIAIKTVTVDQLVAMADGLVSIGQTTLAGQLYRSALAREPGRANLRVRIGLTAARSPRTGMMLDTLRTIEGAGLARPFVAEGLATWMKTLPFEDDPRFQDLADRHAGLLPLANWQWNLHVALWAVREARHVPGDLVELGVFKGHTTLFCAEYVEFQRWDKQWWLYDTFEGIPEDQLSPGWESVNDKAYTGTFSLEEVTERFAPFPNISVIKGRVPEILHERSPEAIAFLHVDMNNAPAEIAALDLLFERVSPGGVVLFDDYCWHSARTQHQAERAWFEDRGLQVLPLPTGQGLFVKRR